MNYEQHKQAALECSATSDKFKIALTALDDMDCVKALNYARTLFAMMQKRVGEADDNPFANVPFAPERVA